MNGPLEPLRIMLPAESATDAMNGGAMAAMFRFRSMRFCAALSTSTPLNPDGNVPNEKFTATEPLSVP